MTNDLVTTLSTFLYVKIKHKYHAVTFNEKKN